MKQKIVPHLWFDKEAVEAAKLYSSIFKGKVKNVTTIHNTPSGDCDIVSFELFGQEFMAMSAGPLFKFTPAISFLVACSTKEEVEAIYNKLAKGGKPLMELGSYPFSEKYGWIADKYGLSWQIMHMGDRKITQRITPVMMFVGKMAGKAEEAMKLYTSVFKNAKMGDMMRYGKNQAPDKEGTITFGSFVLESQEFAAMDSAGPHKFAFNEAISFIVKCGTQKEIDHYWGKLSAVPESEQCGWLKDKFGVSWQITPTAMEEMMGSKDEAKMARVTAAFLQMKKFDIATLKKAYEGK